MWSQPLTAYTTTCPPPHGGYPTTLPSELSFPRFSQNTFAPSVATAQGEDCRAARVTGCAPISRGIQPWLPEPSAAFAIPASAVVGAQIGQPQGSELSMSPGQSGTGHGPYAHPPVPPMFPLAPSVPAPPNPPDAVAPPVTPPLPPFPPVAVMPPTAGYSCPQVSVFPCRPYLNPYASRNAVGAREVASERA